MLLDGIRTREQYAEDDEKQPDLPGDESKQPEKGHDLAHMTAPSKDQRLQALRPGNGQRNGKCENHGQELGRGGLALEDRKSTRLNSSHRCISYAVFCLKKKKNEQN